MVITKNQFINLIALTRFTPFTKITKDICNERNSDKIEELQKSIEKHTMFYFFVYLTMGIVFGLTKSSVLFFITGLILISLFSTGIWAWFGFKKGKIVVDSREYRREYI